MTEDIEFIKDYGTCWKKGDRFRRIDRPQFAAVMIKLGFAKAVNEPAKHKMIEKPEKEKRHYFVG